VLLWCYSGYIILHLPFLAFYFCSAYFLHLEYYKWYQSTFLGRKLWVKFFFRVETYSGVFKPQRSVVTCINPWLRDSYTQEIQVVLKHRYVDHLVIHVGTPSSGSASDNTCVRIGLDFLKPSLDKPIVHLTVIVPPRTTLRKILSSTWVVG
jgi:hypothetical protein